MNFDYLQTFFSWILSHGAKIIFIIVGTFILHRFLKIFVVRFMKRIIRKGFDVKIEEEREKTLLKSLVSILGIILWIASLLMILSELNINIAPLLTSIGVAGLALGLGARSLIQDYLSGFFILLEDQYRVGERVAIAGVEGVVSDFNLRKTVIKDEKENLHFIPNSTIKQTTNFSRK